LVLQGWLDRIEPHAAGSPAADDCGELIYQMVHRAASAAAACEPGGHPAMAYVVFRDGEANTHFDDYRADLHRLRSAIGDDEGFPFFLASVPIRPTEAFQEVAGLKKGDSETGEAVRRSLTHGSPPLFDFAEPKIQRI